MEEGCRERERGGDGNRRNGGREGRRKGISKKLVEAERAVDERGSPPGRREALSGRRSGPSNYLPSPPTSRHASSPGNPPRPPTLTARSRSVEPPPTCDWSQTRSPVGEGCRSNSRKICFKCAEIQGKCVDTVKRTAC